MMQRLIADRLGRAGEAIPPITDPSPGLDSLMAADVLHRIEESFPGAVVPARPSGGATIDDLAATIDRELNNGESTTPAVDSSQAEAEAVGPLSEKSGGIVVPKSPRAPDSAAANVAVLLHVPPTSSR